MAPHGVGACGPPLVGPDGPVRGWGAEAAEPKKGPGRAAPGG